jgi:hypothetical protein
MYYETIKIPDSSVSADPARLGGHPVSGKRRSFNKF